MLSLESAVSHSVVSEKHMSGDRLGWFECGTAIHYMNPAHYDTTAMRLVAKVNKAKSLSFHNCNCCYQSTLQREIDGLLRMSMLSFIHVYVAVIVSLSPTLLVLSSCCWAV